MMLCRAKSNSTSQSKKWFALVIKGICILKKGIDIQLLNYSQQLICF